MIRTLFLLLKRQIVGGDEKGSFKSETVKYGRESQGLGPEKECAGKGQ
jgi:hypothetical protein